MKFNSALITITLLGSALAHPWMRAGAESAGSDMQKKSGGCPFGFDKMKRDGETAEELQKRILGLGEGGGLLGLGLEETVGNVLTGAGGLLEGLLGRVAKLGEGEKRIPDAAHPFQAPGPGDQRGPCPGELDPVVASTAGTGSMADAKASTRLPTMAVSPPTRSD